MFRELKFGEGAVDFGLVNAAITALEHYAYPAAIARQGGEGIAPAPYLGEPLTYFAFPDNIDTRLL